MSLLAWVERYKESVALSPEDFRVAEALAIAVEALDITSTLGDLKTGFELKRIAEDALRRIESLGESK